MAAFAESPALASALCVAVDLPRTPVSVAGTLREQAEGRDEYSV